MDALITQEPASSPQSFNHFLFKNHRNRQIIKIACIAIVLQFIIFKLLYPSAGFINADSYNYLAAASWNIPIHTYMIGYSKFLRLFSVFSSSDTLLVAFQYLSIQFSGLFLVFTIIFFYNIGKPIQIILFLFTILNPLFLYMSNYVTSDSLFLSLSLTWFSLLLWIIHQPSLKIISLEIIVLFISFTFRYNALIYPFIAILAYTISENLSSRERLIGILSGFLATGLFVAHTASKYKELTGYWQYSPFSGWLLANNAIDAYRFVDSTDRKPVPEKFKRLDNMVRTYLDTTYEAKTYEEELAQASTIYMWDHRSPLFKYQDLVFAHVPSSEFGRWASMGPLYSQYGHYIIRQYPKEYIRHFLWPNFNKYYATPVEYLNSYNMGRDTIDPIAQTWFEFKTNKVRPSFGSFQVHLLDFYPILAGMMNVLFLAGLIFFYSLKGIKKNPLFSKSIMMAATIWTTNLLFTVLASPAALRFQAFPLFVFTIFGILLVDYAIKTAIKLDTNNESTLQLELQSKYNKNS